MRESDLIRAMWEHFPRCEEQKNRLFSTDAEIVTIGDALWAITVDEFSAAEDGFGTIDTETLGHNLVAAVLSDLVAVGATPQFFLHTIALPPGTEDVRTLSIGISEALNRVGAFLIGGDIGQAPAWRYSGVAMGPIESGRVITREVPVAEQDLWVTGTLGGVNLAMVIEKAVPRLSLHSSAVRRFIAEHATACIDTSSGFADALWAMHEQSPGVRFEVDAMLVPFDPGVIEYSAAFEVPPVVFMLGGAGEYELVFTMPVGTVPDPEIGATRIGQVLPSTKNEIIVKKGDRLISITEPPPCPREYRNRNDYIRAILEQAWKIVSQFG